MPPQGDISGAATRPRAVPQWPTSRTVYYVAALAIALFGFVLRAWNLAGADPWADEVLTAYRAQAPLSEAVNSILSAGNQVPLYYAMMRLLPHESVVALRWPSVVFGVLGILTLIHALTILFDNAALGLQAGALLAVNPLHVILSRTARFYTWLFLLSVLITFCFVLLLRRPQSRRLWWAFGALTLVANLTHYTAVGLGASQFLLLLLFYRRQRALWRRWFVTQFFAALPAALWGALASASASSGGNPPPRPDIFDLPVSFLNVLMGYGGELEWVFLPGVVVSALGLVGGLHAVGKMRARQPEMLYWPLLAAIPIVTLFAVSMVLFAKYKDRYFMIAMPALLVLFLVGWQRAPRLARYGAVGVVLFTGLGQVLHLYASGDYERTAWSKAGQVVATAYREGDCVVFARWALQQAFATSFRGDPQIVEQSALARTPEELETLAQRCERLLVPYRFEYEDHHRQEWVRDFDPLARGISPLADWLYAHRDGILARWDFQGVTVFVVATARP